MNIMIKLFAIALLISIVYNLAKAMLAMLSPNKSTQPMSRFIGRRLLFSVLLIALLLLSLFMGWLQPNPRPY